MSDASNTEERTPVLNHQPCLKCGSSDAMSIFDNGSAYCHSCNTNFPDGSISLHEEDGSYYHASEGTPMEPSSSSSSHSSLTFTPVTGDISFLSKRKIKEETCRKYGYKQGVYKGKGVHIENFYQHDGQLVAQHLRFANKDFIWLGDSKKASLWGQHLWKAGKGGKRIIITEGAIDAMSVSQCLNNKWPVVSLPSGASSAKKYIQKELEYLESYEEVVFCFDMDEPGKKAARACAELITPGKAKVVSLPRKDANDMLIQGEVKQLLTALWEAQVFRPDGIVAANDLSLDSLMVTPEFPGYTVPYPKLDNKLHNLRKGELSLFTAGSGVGKSTLVRELEYHLLMKHKLKVASVRLEESIQKSTLGLFGIHNNIPLGSLYMDRNLLSKEQWESSYKDIVKPGRLFLYDHFGSLESENLMSKLRYLAVGCEVDFIVLDHISIVISGIEDGDERRIIDNLMTNLRSLVENTGVGVIAICHLKQPEGKPHEEGARVTLSHLRGSGTLKQLPDNIIAMERDQQGDDKDRSLVRLLKCRLFGDLGPCDSLVYQHDTGRLLAENDDCFFDEHVDKNNNNNEDF